MDHQEQHPATAPLDAKGAARRRFTRLGAGATGVILTLYSQPGMAAKGVAGDGAMCVAPSGFMSADSRGPQVSCDHNRSHDYWKNHPDAWATRANIDYKAKFGTIFPATGRYVGLADLTLMEVLNPSQDVKEIDFNHVAMQSVVALLNARSASYAGVPSVLPEESVMEIWNEFAVHGYYTPSSGASIWSGPQVAEYFESTFR